MRSPGQQHQRSELETLGQGPQPQGRLGDGAGQPSRCENHLSRKSSTLATGTSRCRGGAGRESEAHLQTSAGAAEALGCSWARAAGEAPGGGESWVRWGELGADADSAELGVCDSGLCELSRGRSGFGDGSEILTAGQGRWGGKASPPSQRSGRPGSGFRPPPRAWSVTLRSATQGLAAGRLQIAS